MILKFKNKAAAHMQEQKVRKIFNSISLRYDLANFFISLGIEKILEISVSENINR